MGNENPEAGGDKGQREGPRDDGAEVAASHQQPAATQSNQSRQEAAAGGCEQHSDQTDGQIAESHPSPEAARFCQQKKGGEWKAKIEETSDIVGILSFGGEADLGGGVE